MKICETAVLVLVLLINVQYPGSVLFGILFKYI